MEPTHISTRHYYSRSTSHIDPTRIKNLEDEQEILSTSLLALTSHFAQVQFRLRQIVDAPAEQRDELLASLEEFAFRGIPDEVTKLDGDGGGGGDDDVGDGEDAVDGNNDDDEGQQQDDEQLFKAMERQRARQFELIDQLKKQLAEVERFAYESGAKVLPTSVLVEKQRVIIDELKAKLNLNVCDDDLPQLSTEQLRSQVDTALGELVGPIKMKDTLVGQLKTQIVDLERFVAYLQCETYDLKKMTKAMGGLKNYESATTYNSKMAKSRQQQQQSNGATPKSRVAAEVETTDDPPEESLAHKAANVLDKASAVLNIFAITQCGVGRRFQKNTLKKTTKGNHWGDLRAQLEIDIQEIISLVASIPPPNNSNRQRRMAHKASPDSSSDSDEDGAGATSSAAATTTDDDESTTFRSTHHRRHRSLSNCFYSDETLASIQMEITTMIRKHFAITLQRLMEHGLRENVQSSSSSLVPFIGCFGGGARRTFLASSQQESRSDRQNYNGDYDDDDNEQQQHRQMHVWELILEYYHIKNGDKFNETPARKLSQSFNLDIAGGSSGSAASNKQSLLGAIGTIISVHAPYKRSYNSHFKALVSTGLKYVFFLFFCVQKS